MAGNIQWCRQLLRRIELPMKQFQQNKHILTTKESKKIIRTRLGLRTTRVPGGGVNALQRDNAQCWHRVHNAAQHPFFHSVFVSFPRLLGANIQPGLLRPAQARTTRWRAR